MRLLLIEEDEMIGDPIADAMRRAGHTVDWARDGRGAEQLLKPDIYDLVLLDADLSKCDAIDLLLRYRRQGGRAAVIMLTDTPERRIGNVDAGADDVLIKPFDLDRLVSRVCSLLRRRNDPEGPVYSHGALVLDAVSNQATMRGQALSLDPFEFALLQALLEEPMRVCTRSELEERLPNDRGKQFGGDAIESHVQSLRCKIGAEQIVTVRGVGYRLSSME
ncbi:response regulator [Paraburkholderia hospita]|uniref:Two component transcriptional regulator n=1 Tax=Paraburkholderia hospita TaxID=169430 RepID=A0ABN0FAL3_9BURK|nr:response regulator transcription factor [Paraburkholderia hospita]EIM95602.1 two component transcriptional regulator [Paraburkholderia hospita]OUL70908.1 DNA-binding response regulator [Paraburkholderia hospita]OUL80469.1 DNA-binding response regulator [Paraburkholderia hospita]OUL93710.1 DNA-binding response regulator [Paraburkholderia hospita]